MRKFFERFFSRIKTEKSPTNFSDRNDNKYLGYHLLFPESSNALFALAEYYLRDDSVTIADQIFAQAISKGGKKGIKENILAYWDYRRGNFLSARDNAAIAIAEGFATHSTYMIAGASTYRLGDQANGLFFFEKGIDSTYSAPQLAEIFSGIASCAFETGDFSKALSAINTALRYDPRNESALLAATIIYDPLGLHEHFNQASEALLRWHPDSLAGQLNRGSSLLAEGNYLEGWKLREARLKLDEFKNHYIRPSLLERPLWDGSLFGGKRLLIFCEQGMGDNVMMARFFPLVQSLGGELTIECQAESIPLLQSASPSTNWVPLNSNKDPDIEFDFWVPSMSIPHLLEITIDKCGMDGPYISVASDINTYWEMVLPKDPSKLRVGICWSGNPTLRMDKLRSMNFCDIKPLFDLKDIDFHLLQIQHDIPSQTPKNLYEHTGELLTLADTAGLMARMDLIITIDSVTAHIGGALNLPTWLMLPDNYEWRWTRTDRKTPWYPSVTVFRQSRFACWVELLAEIKQELIKIN